MKDWDAGSWVRMSPEGLKHYIHDPEWRAQIVGGQDDPFMIAIRLPGQKKVHFINRKYLTPA